MEKKRISVLEKGPYKVTGDVKVKQTFIVPDRDNQSEKWRDGKEYENPSASYCLCRCGHSQDKPYCDGAHIESNFQGEEKAKHATFDESSRKYRGETIDLLDNRDLCAVARFCDRGDTTWRMVKKSSDPELEQQAIYEACACPSGRLVVARKNGEKIEPELEQEIGVVQDVAADCKGPLWVKGGIEIEDSKGVAYEVRNRVTLCRCGESNNMPFCDAAHLECAHMKKLDR